MNKPTDSERLNKKPRRKFRSKKRSAADLSARMAKRRAIRTSWEGLFYDIKGTEYRLSKNNAL